MKSISKFISLALLIAAATACNTKEIDKPDIPDQPQISGNVRFTASMKQTRVEYSVNGDKLHQCWEVDDVIYGFYGDNPVGKVTLKVTEVDEDTEYATLEATVAEEGADFIAAIKNAGEEHIPVGLLYTGSNDNAVNNKTVTVDMHNQSRGNIPACMTSTLYEITKDSESGDTLIQFDFDNECAILEIQSLTGIAETAGLPEGQTIDLASIEVAGVLPYCKYTYDDGSFSSEQSNEYYNSVIVKPTTERPLKANSNGNIVDADGNISCIRIAVSATSPFSITSTEITVTATSDDDDDDPEVYRSKYKGVLHPGCYIICAQDVVAKTEDGFYFTTVKAAFDHAEYLNTNSLLGDKPNIVTLLKSEIDGLGEQTASPAHNEQIEIDYNVTLDLNGCTLSLSGAECFNVNNIPSTPATFTITDSNGLNNNDEYEGKIKSTSEIPTIYNTSRLIVSGGIISSSLHYAVYCDGGSIEMSDGEISCSHSSFGALVLNDAVNSSISGGTLTSSGKSTISITGTSTLDVSGGKIICTGQDSAIEIDARDPEKIKSPTLTVRWPDNDVKDQPSGVYEPFLYSPKRAPIFENSSHTDHFSTVYIKGGFLYTGTSVRYFYKSDNSNTALQATSGYYFYSNVSYLHSNASGVKASSTTLSSAITIDASTHGVPGVTTGLSFGNKISIEVK